MRKVARTARGGWPQTARQPSGARATIPERRDALAEQVRLRERVFGGSSGRLQQAFTALERHGALAARLAARLSAPQHRWRGRGL